MKKLLSNILLILVLMAHHGYAAEDESWGDDWGDDKWEEESPHSSNYEVLYSYGHLLDSNSVNIENYTLNELRFDTEYQYKTTGFTFKFEAELFVDQLTDESEVVLDELSLYVPVSGGTDIKVGRQVVTWGTADLLFLNDLFVKDWKSFFNGREDTDLKDPVDAIRLSHYGDLFNVDFAYVPDFEADKVMTGERYSFYIPGFGIVQPQPELNPVKQDEPEFAARIFANSDGTEWAFYMYEGFYKSPSKFLPDGTMTYAEMRSYGASIRTNVAGGLFNAEWSHYKSLEDEAGTNPFINNSQSRILIGYETELVTNLTIGLQAYLEKTEDYSQLVANLFPGQIAPDENRTMTTMRLTHQALQQKLLNSLMIFYSPSDKDHYLRYSSQYKFDDRWKLIAGVNLLDGKYDYTFLSQLKDNSNVFFRIHYSF
ncbi:MAG: hypothetical protein OEY19_03930 [Gammaproteobacteria bacterium]|nr:hypothetical protein [Gammaproteobacteria bacterium]